MRVLRALLLVMRKLCRLEAPLKSFHGSTAPLKSIRMWRQKSQRDFELALSLSTKACTFVLREDSVFTLQLSKDCKRGAKGSFFQDRSISGESKLESERASRCFLEEDTFAWRKGLAQFRVVIRSRHSQDSLTPRTKQFPLQTVCSG